MWLWVKGYRCSCSGPMQGQIAFQGITRKFISIWCQTFPISVCNLISRDFRDYAVHMGNNQTFKVFPDSNGKGGGHLPRLLWMSLFTHKDGSFSGEHSHPERIQWSLWHCTHINQGQEFCLCLIVCVASLQVLVGVYGWERARNIPLVLPPGVDRHLFYTALGAFYTDVCLSHWTGPKEQLHGVNCNTHTHTYTQCKIAIISVSNALNIPQNTARSITNKMRKCGTHLNFTTMKDATNPQNLNVHEYPQCRQ